MFDLTINYAGAALDAAHARDGIADMLESAARNLRDGHNSATLRDANGNRAGGWEYAPEPEPIPDVSFQGHTYGMGVWESAPLTIQHVVLAAARKAVDLPAAYGWNNEALVVFYIERTDGHVLQVEFSRTGKDGIISGFDFTEHDEHGGTVNVDGQVFDVDDAETYLESFAEQIQEWIDGGEIG